MCLLCIEIQKGNMSAQDIARNFGELVETDPKHAEEIAEKHGDQIAKSIFEEDDFGELTDDPWYFFVEPFDD